MNERSALQRIEADDIVGYVFAINGKITGGDVYASSALFGKMWRKLLIANITEAISEKNGATASPPSLEDVQRFLTAADSVPPSERPLNTGVRLATGSGDSYVSTGIKRADGGWVHRNYLPRLQRSALAPSMQPSNALKGTGTSSIGAWKMQVLCTALLAIVWWTFLLIKRTRHYARALGVVFAMAGLWGRNGNRQRVAKKL